MAQRLKLFAMGRGKDIRIFELDEITALLLLHNFPSEFESFESGKHIPFGIVTLQFQQLDISDIDSPQLS